MDVRITARHVELSESFTAFAHERTRKLLKYEPRLTAVDLLFEDDHGRFTTEVRADVPGVPPLIARAGSEDRRSALDSAIRKLGRQLRRERSKRLDHQAPPAAARIED
ncbi:MAG: ribosome hibernation-promoting factor, HPF/YfiA family [Gemmatimonadota bacterium]